LGIAHDFLEQAKHLASYQGLNATQADLRRAISTAYYALFHLLVEDGSQRWQGGSAAAESGIQRAFDHGPMYHTSTQFSTPFWRDWHGLQRAVPPALQRVAKAFVNLRDERQAADYDNHQQWAISDAEEVLNIAKSAFQDWDSVRTDPMAGNYLLAMLLGKRRQ
jgi:uncharacterized protein (UPF0332 family)